MKRILSLILSLILLTASICAFAEEEEILLTTTGEDIAIEDIAAEVVSGGWSFNTTVAALKPDSLEKQAFKRAVKKHTGTNLTLLDTLAEQVVAGTNYCFLCHSSATTYPPVNSLCLVYVYQNLQGKAKITEIKSLKLKHKPSGGWVLSSTQKEAKVENAANRALKLALANLVGADYKPLMVLGRGAK